MRLAFHLPTALVTLILVVAGVASASAQDDVRKRGDKACGADSRRMCSKFFGEDMAVLACLQQNKVRLSGACRKFLTDIGQLQ
ncbi:MAG: hypothetical protein WDO17_08065 [Alphaproteobacteria bacterium]